MHHVFEETLLSAVCAGQSQRHACGPCDRSQVFTSSMRWTRELLQAGRHRRVRLLAALLASDPSALVRADAHPPHSLHSLLSRWCWQMPAPPHSLHLLLWRWWWPMKMCMVFRGAPPGIFSLTTNLSRFSTHAHGCPGPPLIIDGSGQVIRSAWRGVFRAVSVARTHPHAPTQRFFSA